MDSSSLLPGGAESEELDLGESIPALIAIFDALQVFGFLSLAAILITAWRSSNVRRSETWYAFILNWMWWCVSYSIIIGQQTGPPPNHKICLMQAALVYSAPVLTSWGTLAPLLQLFFSVYSLFSHQSCFLTRFGKPILMLGPVVLYLTVLCQVLGLGIANPDLVQRDPSGMYCNFSGGTQRQITGGFVIGASITILFFEIWTAALLGKNWGAFRRLETQGAPTSGGGRIVDNRIDHSAVSLPMIIRVSVFSFLPMGTLILGLLNTLPDRQETALQSSQTNLVTAALSGAAGIIFSTQQDNLNVWMSLFKKKSKSSGTTLNTMKPLPSRPSSNDV